MELRGVKESLQESQKRLNLRRILPEIRKKRDLRCPLNPALQTAIENFLGAPLVISEKKKFPQIPKRVKVGRKTYVDIERIPFDSETNEATSHFGLHVFSQLDEKDQQLLKDYALSGRGELLMVRREKTSGEFYNALARYSRSYHEGIAPITEIVSAFQGMQQFGNPLPENQQAFSLQERQDIKQLIDISPRSLEFIILPKNNQIVRQDVARALEHFNAALDPYEFAYNVILATTEMQRKQGVGALMLTGLSLIAPKGLEQITQRYNEFASMVTSHTAGDVFARVIALFGSKSKESGKEEPVSVLQNIRKAMQSAPKVMKNLLQEVKENPRNYRSVLLPLGISAANTVLLSYLSIQTGILPLFLLIGPLNTSIINIFEISSRASRAQKVSKNIEQEEALIHHLQQKNPKALRPLISKFPNLFTALTDFRDNRTAFAAWAGTFFSLGFLSVITSLYPALPQSWILAASGIGIENAFGAGGGILSSRQDPWKRFETIRPLLDDLSHTNGIQVPQENKTRR